MFKSIPAWFGALLLTTTSRDAGTLRDAPKHDKMRGIISSLTALVLMGATTMVAQSISQFPTGQAGLQDIAFDGTNIWVAGFSGVTKLRASDGTNLGTFSLPSLYGVVFDGTNIWVTNDGNGPNANTVTKLRSSDGATLGTFPVGLGPMGIAFDGVNIWVANVVDNTVTKLRVLDGALLGTFPVGSSPREIAFDGSNMWVTNNYDGTVTKLRARDGTNLGTFTVGSGPIGVVFDGSSIWVTNFTGNNITKLRADDGTVLGSFPAGDRPVGVAFDGTNIWVGNFTSASGGEVTELRAADGATLRTVVVGGAPWGLVFDGANIWVADGPGSSTTCMFCVGVIKISDPVPTVSSSALDFDFQVGGAAPTGQSVLVGISGAGPLNFSVAENTSSGGSWLFVTPTMATTPTTLTISVIPSGLMPAIYTGTVTVSGTGSAPTTSRISVTLTVIPPALPISASPTNLTFNYRGGDPNPPVQSLQITGSAGETFSAQASSNGSWLAVSPNDGTAPAALSVSVSASQLNPGSYTGTIQVNGTLGGIGQTTVNVTLTVIAVPAINAGGVVNAADYAPGVPLSPGSEASVFGNFLVSSSTSATGVALPTSLSSVSLQFGSGGPVPLYFLSSTQANIQVPWELSGQSLTQLTVTANGQTSAPLGVILAPFSPGIYSTNSQGTGQGAIVDNSTYQLVDPSHPATAGSSIVQIYCTGLGAVTRQPATGSPASGNANALSVTLTTPTVTIGGVPATVFFSGLAPGFVGEYQVNVQVPANAPAGNAMPVVLSIGGINSNKVTIAVQSSGH